MIIMIQNSSSEQFSMKKTTAYIFYDLFSGYEAQQFTSKWWRCAEDWWLWSRKIVRLSEQGIHPSSCDQVWSLLLSWFFIFMFYWCHPYGACLTHWLLEKWYDFHIRYPCIKFTYIRWKSFCILIPISLKYCMFLLGFQLAISQHWFR